MFKYFDQLVAYLRGMGHAVSTPSDIHNLKKAIAEKMNEGYAPGDPKRITTEEIEGGVERFDDYLYTQAETGRITQEFAEEISTYLDDVLEARTAEQKIAQDMYDHRGRTVLINSLEEAIPDPVFSKNLIDKYGEAEVLEAVRIKANSSGLSNAQIGMPSSTPDDELVWLLEGRNHPTHPLHYEHQVGASDKYKQAVAPAGDNITDIATAKPKLSTEDLNKLDEELRIRYIDEDAAGTMTLEEFAIQERGYGYPASTKHPSVRDTKWIDLGREDVGISKPDLPEETFQPNLDDIYNKMREDPVTQQIMDSNIDVISKELDKMDFGSKQMQGATKQLEIMTARMVELEKAGDFDGARLIKQTIDDYAQKVKDMDPGDPNFPMLVDPTRKPHAMGGIAGGRINYADGTDPYTDDLFYKTQKERAYWMEKLERMKRRRLMEMSENAPSSFYETLSYVDPTGKMGENIADHRLDMLETEFLYDDYLHRMKLDAAREIFDKQIDDFEKKQEPKLFEAAQGGRVGLYGGGFAETLAGDIMAEDDEFMQVADVTRGDIHNIKTMGMAGYSVHDMLNSGALSDNITDDEVRGVMEGTITEPITSEKKEKKWFGIF